MDLNLTSTAFENMGNIPQKFACDGENISTELKWSNPDKTVKSYALLVHDPDARSGDHVHWIIFNISGSVNELPENYSGTFPQGKNGSGKEMYAGPCPPSETHRYFFNLYALDTVLDLKSGISKDELLIAMQDHILAQSELMGNIRSNNFS